MKLEAEGLQTLYSNRFGGEEEQRTGTWRVLCSDFFQRWVPRDATVLDLAAGHCEFINNIVAERRIAVDLNPDVKLRAGPEVEALILRSDQLDGIEDHSVDVVFVSNFFEHITRDMILLTMLEVRRVLRPAGRLLVLQPNIRFAARNYWQFFDHITAVDDRALAEAFAATGFALEKCIPRFLPFSTKSWLPSLPSLVRLYLRVPLAWRVLGAQSFMVATPADG